MPIQSAYVMRLVQISTSNRPLNLCLQRNTVVSTDSCYIIYPGRKGFECCYLHN